MLTNVKESMTARKKFESYKCACQEKKYHITPAIPDEDYGPDATAPDITSQQKIFTTSVKSSSSPCVLAMQKLLS